MDEVLVERVLRAVEQVPPGRVVSYGVIADLVGTGPRQVGTVMSRWGSTVAWWRVTNRAGELPADLLPEARRHWHEEGIGEKAGGKGCRYPAYLVDLDQLAEGYRRATADLDDVDAAG